MTIRVSALRPVQPMDLRPPIYSWKVIECRDFLERDTVNIIFATVAENRQHHGYYGDRLDPEAFFISGISKHLFEVEVFYDGGRDCVRIYLESPGKTHVANPQEGLGKLAGIIVFQENENVFEGGWIDQSRAVLDGKRPTYQPGTSSGMVSWS